MTQLKRLFRRSRRPKSSPLGISMNNGNPMVLDTPFDRMAVRNGAIFLWHSGSGAELRVPADARAYLTGTVSHDVGSRGGQ